MKLIVSIKQICAASSILKYQIQNIKHNVNTYKSKKKNQSFNHCESSNVWLIKEYFPIAAFKIHLLIFREGFNTTVFLELEKEISQQHFDPQKLIQYHTLNLAVIWFIRGMNSWRSFASQSLSMCSEAEGMNGRTSSSRQIIMRWRKVRTPLLRTSFCNGQLRAGRNVCKQSR